MPETVRVDLHCHSSASDGDHPPAHVARRLADVGASWAALTDHNTVSGQAEFRAALERHSIYYVPGVEIDARSSLGPVHILGYAIDTCDAVLLAALETVRHPWRTSTRRFFARLHAPRSMNAVEGSAVEDPVETAFPRAPLSTAVAIGLIHDAGGLAFLAHPLESLATFKRLEQVLDQLQAEGMDGLEVFHKSYPEHVRSGLLALAGRRGLIPTGGSDFHGLHHSDGASLGVDVPLEEWTRIMMRFGNRLATTPFAVADDGTAH